MAKSTHGGKAIHIRMRVDAIIPGNPASSSGRGVRCEVIVAPLAPDSTSIRNADIEAGRSRSRSMAWSTVAQAVRERSGQPLGRRAMQGRVEEGDRVGKRRRATPVVDKSNRQPGIAQLLSGIVAVAQGGVTSEISLVVCSP